MCAHSHSLSALLNVDPLPRPGLHSGESGAGKTETSKFIISHITRLSHAGAAGTDLARKILQVNPVLEAFGNAQTIMNDNSSRFGKYTELIFGRQGQGNTALFRCHFSKASLTYHHPTVFSIVAVY